MSLENVKDYLNKFGAAARVREFDVSSATVALAAAALGTGPERIAKSIAFDAGGQPVLIITAGDAKIDNTKFKERFHAKARMLSPEETEQATGHAVGGVCPFAVKEGVRIYLDDSLKRFETVFPACGSANSAIELTIAELEEYTPNEGWVDVCKLRPPE